MAQNDESRYDSWPAYTGDDLELKVDASGTHFTLWSPEAESAKVNIYDTDRNTPAVQTIEMHKGDKGTWRATVPEQLYGKFYTFAVTVEESENNTVNVCAPATTWLFVAM